MIEKVVMAGVVVVVTSSMLTALLPRLLPAITALFVFAVVGRYVWWYTRR